MTAPRRGKPPRHLGGPQPSTSVASRGGGPRACRPIRRQAALDALLRPPHRPTPRTMTDLPKAVPRGARRAGSCPSCSLRCAAITADAGCDDQVRSTGCTTGRSSSRSSCATRSRVDDLHLQPGRVRHELPLLRHRAGGPDKRNMSTAEIVDQVVAAATACCKRGELPVDRQAPSTSVPSSVPSPSEGARCRGLRSPQTRGSARVSERRLHGDGRGAGQLQGGHRSDPAD
jgi:hypothetical protein